MSDIENALSKELLLEVSGEAIAVNRKRGRTFNSAHELHSVLREEFDEFWDEVKLKQPSSERMEYELLDVAVTALRGIEWLRSKRND